MAGVSQPLNLGDKLREALQDAQRVMDEYHLNAKIKVTTEGPAGGVGAAESGMDRTERDAREQAEKTGGAGGGVGSGPLNPTDRLADSLERLIKVMSGFGDSLGKGGGRRYRAGAPGATPLDDEPEAGGPGYVNPYLVQGLISNPLGTTQNTMMSMLMGGAGAGVKAPGWLLKMLSGTESFSPGAALASETGLLSSGAAGSFASAGLIGAAKIAVPVAAFGGMMAYQNSVAKDRMQDAQAYMADQSFGRGLGVNWREGMWGTAHMSREDVYAQGVQEVAGGMGVGLQGLTRSAGGTWGMMGELNKAVNLGLQVGASSGQMGSVIGASVRSGSVALGGADANGQFLHLLSLIEQWTKKGADNGLSTSESMQRMAEISQLAMQGTNIVTPEATRSLLSAEARMMSGLPDELKRGGSRAIGDALAAAPSGETQRVMLMNTYLDQSGDLSAEGRAAAVAAFGEHQVSTTESQMGRAAGTILAEKLTHNRLGVSRARASLMRGSGASGMVKSMAFGSGDMMMDAQTMAMLDKNPDLFKIDTDLNQREPTGPGAGGGSVDGMQEATLARLAQRMERLSGTTADSAEAMVKAAAGATELARATVEAADRIRQGTGDGARPIAPHNVHPMHMGR